MGEGIDLFFEKTGNGPDLILLHGNSEDHTIFNEGVKLLAERYTVYALDTRGHGQSPKVNEFHYSDMADDVIRFIKVNKLSKPIVYGFSDGGIVAIMVAIRESSLIRSIAVSGANITVKGVKGIWQLVFKFAYFTTQDPRLKLMNFEPEIPVSDLKKITVPALVIAGQRDLIKEQETRLIASSIPQSKLMILPREGHGSYIVHKTKFAEILLEELKER